MPDLATLIDQMNRADTFARLVNNPLAQFGRRARTYLGASLLPERTVPANEYKEEGIIYRSVIANAGTRYSPVQLRGGALVGSFLVVLAESDAGSQFTSREYDALLTLLAANQSMDATAQLLRWADTLTTALVEWNERARWQAIVSAAVTLSGDNGYAETITYSDPTNHRAAAGGTWSSDTYDPFDDIFAMVSLLASKGYTVARMITSRNVVSIMGGNAKVAARTGRVTVSGGALVGIPGRASLAAINGALAADGLPPIEVYDLQYRTLTSTGRFLPNDVFVLTCNTGRDEAVDLGDTNPIPLLDTLGYTAVGRPAGQAGPGRVLQVTAKTDKPPRLEGEGWQTSLPVITEPEAIAVINSIA